MNSYPSAHIKQRNRKNNIFTKSVWYDDSGNDGEENQMPWINPLRKASSLDSLLTGEKSKERRRKITKDMIMGPMDGRKIDDNFKTIVDVVGIIKIDEEKSNANNNEPVESDIDAKVHTANGYVDDAAHFVNDNGSDNIPINIVTNNEHLCVVDNSGKDFINNINPVTAMNLVIELGVCPANSLEEIPRPPSMKMPKETSLKVEYTDEPANEMNNVNNLDNVGQEPMIEDLDISEGDIFHPQFEIGCSDDEDSTIVEVVASEEDVNKSGSWLGKLFKKRNSNGGVVGIGEPGFSVDDGVLLRTKSVEVLKTLQTNNEPFPGYHPPKFPLTEDLDKVEVRENNIRHYRYSKSTNFDFRRKPISSSQDFDVKGCVKIQLPNKQTQTKLKEYEIIRYQNGDIYKYDEKLFKLEILRPHVTIKQARLLNRKEVELKDANGLIYILIFGSSKDAKCFIENDKISCYIENEKFNITKRLLRLLGKRASREVLEKKGIYQNEPIFGNTLKNIFIVENGVPRFIQKTLELIERPENIMSLGLYRTSGNLATIQKIRFEVDKGKLDILNDYAKDPDVLTGSLKLFFRELKEPLISCEACDSLLTVMRGEKHYARKDRDKIRSILNHLPDCNSETLRILIRHLIEVVKYKDQNKMDAYNLAVCWGPTIIFATDSIENLSSRDLVTQSTEATRLFDALLTFFINNPEELESRRKNKQEPMDLNRHTIQRQESRDSIQSSDSNNSKSQKKSHSNLSLNIDECLKKYVELIEVNLESNGLYQKSGSIEKVGKVMRKMTKKKIYEIDKYKNDVHVLTDCLKKYLKEYPEALTTREVVEQVNKLCDNTQCLEQNTRQKVKSIIREGPNKDTLIFLVNHIIKVTEYEHYHNVPKPDMISIWADIFNYQHRIIDANEKFFNFLRILLDVFDDSKPDITIQKGMSNGLLNDLKNLQHQKEKDRISKYDNVPDEPELHREATILEEKTDIVYTKL